MSIESAQVDLHEAIMKWYDAKTNLQSSESVLVTQGMMRRCCELYAIEVLKAKQKREADPQTRLAQAE
jgi:hypothetical protein